MLNDFQTNSSARGPGPADLPAPHFGYEARYKLCPHTGRPVSVWLNVFARAGGLYNKEYTLTLTPAL